MAKRLLIVGAGGHGRVLADAASEAKAHDGVTFLERGPAGAAEIDGWPCLYGEGDGLDPRDFDMIVGVGNNRRREALQQVFEERGFVAAVVVHPSASVSSRAILAPGSAILAGAVVQTGTRIGLGAIVNNRASIDHHCTVGAFAHLAPGSVVAGRVAVGARSFIGVGACVRDGVTIGADVVVGAGAAVVADLTARGTYVGVPARLRFELMDTPERLV